MKLSVSLPDDDVGFVDEYAAAEGLDSRSAVIRRAIRLLRDRSLEDDYAAAFAEWEKSGEAALWDRAVADGLDGP